MHIGCLYAYNHNCFLFKCSFPYKFNKDAFLTYVLIFSNISTFLTALNETSYNEDIWRSMLSFKPRPLYHQYIFDKKKGRYDSRFGRRSEGKITCQIVHNPFSILTEPCRHNIHIMGLIKQDNRLRKFRTSNKNLILATDCSQI
jgi:hypothetical protein